MEKNKKIFDAQGNEVNLTSVDFEFSQADEKIHDAKFETKATTFARDAFRRFCKNKSSVVATFIIGIIVLLSIFVPIFSPYNVDNPNLKLRYLEPKLFETGTGFWDGTYEVKNIIYDPDVEGPAGYNPKGVVKITNKRDALLNDFSPYAYGGTYIFETDGKPVTGQDYDYLQQNTKINYKLGEDLTLNIEFADEVHDSVNYVFGEYQIVLYNSMNSPVLVLKDWSKDYSDLSINISEMLEINKKSNVLNGKIRFNVKVAPIDGKFPCLLMEKLEYTSNVTDEEVIELLKEVSITDANETKDKEIGEVGYWNSTGHTSVIGAHVSYVDFIFDPYAAQLGETPDFTIGKSIVDTYIANGWMEYDFDKGVESFKILDEEKCPIISVEGQIDNDDIGVHNLKVTVIMYKYLGYDEMPKFLLGTDGDGFDLVKMCFRGLQTSLLLAIITFAVCFTFGLCWGSVSGYFGGNIDLAMERFCEILGGVPWIVVMTLAIVSLGNNLGTFAMALCLTGWMGTAGRTRTQFYRFKGREYILSSRTLGSSDIRLIFKHILPNALGTIVTSAVLMIPSTIFSEASLSYLNLGLQGQNSFGVLLSKYQEEIAIHPMLILFPSLIISLIMISFNLFGNGLRDALNPSLKGSD